MATFVSNSPPWHTSTEWMDPATPIARQNDVKSTAPCVIRNSNHPAMHAISIHYTVMLTALTNVGSSSRKRTAPQCVILPTRRPVGVLSGALYRLAPQPYPPVMIAHAFQAITTGEIASISCPRRVTLIAPAVLCRVTLHDSTNSCAAAKMAGYASVKGTSR